MIENIRKYTGLMVVVLVLLFVGLVFLGERGNGPEKEAVVVPVEVLFVDDIGDIVPGSIIQHQSPDDRLFRFHRMGWDLEVIDALAQFRHARGYFRHIVRSETSAWAANDKPFWPAPKRKRLPNRQPFTKKQPGRLILRR